jgi:aminopeptidase N
MTKEFKYYPEDFGKLPVKVEHFNLTFDVHDDHTIVESDMTMTVLKESLTTLDLDAKNLEVKEVALYQGVRGKGDYEKEIAKNVVEWTYDKENNKLHIVLPKKVQPNETFTLYTKTITRPTKNDLEGLYFDETPKGAPPQQITQCQQWGFQRLVPCFDDMTAKGTYTTTILADSRYTNMISNGDAAVAYKGSNGEPQQKDIGDGRSKIVYLNHTTPMAPYLFFLGVGTYATFRKEFVYPTGEKFFLELLVPPDADEKAAQHALDMLAHGIHWIYDHTGYVYTGDVYREIGMQNSNFGGMENVGNTTITTNRIMPFAQITDGSFVYMLQVKTHEFYHNLNGSEVTGMNPFCLWLNEAVTVYVEMNYITDLFGYDETRIERIQRLYSPVFGTFAEDSGPAAMPIEPVGFNTPDELITGMTYVKAPEFVRMVETLMGREKFKEALVLYYKQYKHSNASSADWLAAMEETSGLDFKEMAHGWLKRTSFPRVTVETSYVDGKYTIELEQKGFGEDEAWQFPFVFNLVKDGKDLLEKNEIYWVKKVKETIVVSVSEEPDYASLNRKHTLYGKVTWINQTQEQLVLQATTDPSIVIRYMAFSTLLDREKIILVKNNDADVSEEFLRVYGVILRDTSLDLGVKASFLAITESVRDESVLYKYDEIYVAQQKMKKIICALYATDLDALYHSLTSEEFDGDYIEKQVAAIRNRSLKNVVLSILSVQNNEVVWKQFDAQLERATNATDRNIAMALLVHSNAPDRIDKLMQFKKTAQQHLVSWESFLAIVGGNNAEDCIDLMKQMEKDPQFRIEQSNDQRALYFSFARNRKKSLLTAHGLAYLVEIIIRVSKLNEYSGFHLLSVFGDLEKLDETHQKNLVGALYNVLEALDVKKQPSVVNNIKRILKNSPNAVKVFEA